jgi:SAM-dependent methyltransferase
MSESVAAWETVAAGWERQRERVWDVSGQVGERLVEALDPRPGESILELACGPGDTGFLAAERIGDTGRLLSTDFAEAMVGAARRRSAELALKNVEHRVIDAQAIDLPDESVDGVLCRWGYMLMPDPAQALAETWRVLRRGGRLACSVWAEARDNPWAAAGARAAVELGFVEPPEPDAPGPFRLGDVARVQALVEGAGFEPPRVEDVPLVWRYADFDDYWSIGSDLSFSLSTLLLTLSQPDVARLRALARATLAPYTGDDGSLTIPGLTRNVTTRKPAAS